MTQGQGRCQSRLSFRETRVLQSVGWYYPHNTHHLFSDVNGFEKKWSGANCCVFGCHTNKARCRDFAFISIILSLSLTGWEDQLLDFVFLVVVMLYGWGWVKVLNLHVYMYFCCVFSSLLMFSWAVNNLKCELLGSIGVFSGVVTVEFADRLLLTARIVLRSASLWLFRDLAQRVELALSWAIAL